jgi:hypothetical protein
MDTNRPGAVTRRIAAVSIAVAAALTAHPAVGRAAPPACGGVPQITDPSGDGHHASSDVLAAWFSEASGHLQAVVQVRAATFLPEHSDADINGSGFAMLFSLGGQTDYVRTRAAPDGSLSYDYGTYTPGGGFASAGTTTGTVERSPGSGATTIDIPPAFGAAAGTILAAPFVLTYDGINGGVPDWVDHAPGGEEPADSARGADYVAGSCGTPSGGGGGGGTGGPSAGPVHTVAVRLSATRRLTGGGRALVTGEVVPARAGVKVSIAHGRRTSTVTTEDDGSFALFLRVGQITRVRALAEGIHSTTLTIDVRSRTRLRVRHTKRGVAYLSGTVAPKLPGRALLLRPNSPATLATRAVSHGRFTFRPTRRLRLRGAYQVVFVPSRGRAERSTSNTARVR